MSKPTQEQLDIALKQSEFLRDHDEDTFYLGKSLLNLHERIVYLERVLHTAKNFLHSGLAGNEQTDLMRAIEAAEKASRGKNEDSEETTFI